MSKFSEIRLSVPEELIDQVAIEVARRIRADLIACLSAELKESRRQSPESSHQPQQTFIRLRQLSARVGLSRSTIYKRMSEGTFPESCKLGPRTTAWLVEDIEAWESDFCTRPGE